MGKTKIYVTESDINKIPADALMVLLFPDFPHSRPLRNLQTVIGRRAPRKYGEPCFRDNIFIFDDLKSSLNKIIYTGLVAANNEGYQSISVSTVEMINRVLQDETPQEAIERIAEGVKDFLCEYSKKTKLENIKFVVYNNPYLAENMSSVLDKI
ncbi:MAG: hypothetical protein AABW83_01590 [Nanoarchaeota archaeon]